jgi:hypothetical protein
MLKNKSLKRNASEGVSAVRPPTQLICRTNSSTGEPAPASFTECISF